MYKKIMIATGAFLLLALGTALAEARPGGGRGGAFGGAGFGGGGGPRMGGGGFGGRSFSGPSFRGGPSFKSGRNFSAPRGMRSYRNFSRRGPNPGWNGRKGGWKQGAWKHGGRDHHHRHRRGRGIYIGAPYFYDYGYYDGYYGDDCGWLYRRALTTGSPYWWSRYRDCAY